MKVYFSHLTEQGCPTSCCAIWCLLSVTQTVSDICVTFVVIDSIIANAQRDAANICNCSLSFGFHWRFIIKLYAFKLLYATFSLCSSILANVSSRSRSLYAVARPSVVCNARTPYSGGCNFRQFFYGIWYLGHPLTCTENCTEIVQGEPSVGRLKPNRGSKI